ncbi:hypothetical protein FQR65_LT15501 [Abscondita terminalis]|nr:hypothetical protein FQR65_LT15501 [Abscondita terminalis]
MKKGLLALAFGGLSIGMTEFTMMGILPDIAKDINVDIPVAAHLIALYALGVFVGAPVFGFIYGLPDLCPDCTMEAFFWRGSVVAAKMSPKGKEAQYIAIMFTGMTVANLLGVPLGTFVGHHYSWRITYGIICSLGLITALAIYLWLPDFASDNSNSIF